MNYNGDTLDPENWEKFTELGHRMLDDMINYLKNIRDTPHMFPTEEAIQKIQIPLPKKGEGEKKVYEIYKKNILPYSTKYTKPNFWGFVVGTGTPFGMLTEMLNGAMNGDEEGFHASHYTNQQVINWIKQIMDYPSEASGVLVGGGSEANFTGLAVGRNAKARLDMKKNGVQGQREKMVLYCSDQTHHCIERAVELLGLGNDALRWIPTDDQLMIKMDSLRDSIEKDKKQGHHPFCVIGNAGTVNSGIFDDFNALAEVCKRENMWFHIDGAYGSWLKLSDKYSKLVDGLERSDSLAVDLHKWMNMPYGIGCTLVKDRLAHFSTFVFGHEAEYLKTADEMMEDVMGDPAYLSLDLSRTLYSLKAYMLMRAYGRDKYCRLVEQNIEQIHYLAELVRLEPRLEITAPLVSNVLCFRYVHEGVGESDLDGVNRMILGELWKINWGMISDTTIKGKYMLRACNVNHRTRYSDFDILVEQITTIGNVLAKEYL
jgi:glutamate/tyrosine decarboxylase-like PLP-dependent enzyme